VYHVYGVILILLSKGEDFLVLQDSLQTAAAHHKVLESQLTDSVAIVEALSNNSLHCNAITSTAVLVSKSDLSFKLCTSLKYADSIYGSEVSEFKCSQFRQLSVLFTFSYKKNCDGEKKNVFRDFD
jgi:hypothetical protein